MRFTASEKQEIIKLVEQSDIGVNRSLKQLGIAKSTFYKWYKLYTEKGLIGLEPILLITEGNGIRYQRKRRIL